jgi:SAM-dependent methyltransferase
LETVPLCLCGAPQGIEVANQDRFGLPIGVVVCLKCGLARTSPRLAAIDLPRFYEEDYHGLHVGVPKPSPSMALFRMGQGRSIYRFVRPWLPLSHIRVAEVGCGTGQVLREFASAATSDSRTVAAVGCEYSSAYVAAGRAAGSAIELGPAETLLPHAPFDLVILSHVVEHFADPERELKVVGQLMAEDGKAYIEVPGVLSIHRKPEYDYEWQRYLTVAHMYHFSLGTLTGVLWRAGFERIAGDEGVRVLVRRRGRNVALPSSPSGLEMRSYLEWLESSRLIQIKRLFLRIRRRAWPASLAVLRRVIGDRGFQALRTARRRLGRRP